MLKKTYGNERIKSTLKTTNKTSSSEHKDEVIDIFITKESFITMTVLMLMIIMILCCVIVCLCSTRNKVNERSMLHRFPSNYYGSVSKTLLKSNCEELH